MLIFSPCRNDVFSRLGRLQLNLKRFNLKGKFLDLARGARAADMVRRRRQLLALAQGEEGVGRVNEKVAELL